MLDKLIILLILEELPPQISISSQLHGNYLVSVFQYGSPDIYWYVSHFYILFYEFLVFKAFRLSNSCCKLFKVTLLFLIVYFITLSIISIIVTHIISHLNILQYY